MRIEAVVTDLDGTFWASDMSIHPASRAAVEVLDRNDVPFLIATGRRGQSALRGLRAAGYEDRPGVLMNGALVRDRLDGPSFLVEEIGTDDALSVYEAFQSADLEPAAYVDDPTHDMVVGERPAVGPEYLSSSASSVRRVPDLAESLTLSPVIGFGAFGYPDDRLRPVADAINEAGWATAIIGRSLIEGDLSLMVQGSGIDKQTGIEAWCRRHEIDHRRLAVLGDAGNDELMLEAAAMAIVPTDASPEIQALADHLIDPAADGGWRVLPELLGLES